MPTIKPIITGALATCSLLLSVSAFSQPDFSGIWGTYRPPEGAGGGGGGFRRAELPLTDYGREQRDDYQALVAGTGMNPGGMCLGYGMPGSALGAGAYPMEWIQRDDIIIQIFEAHSEIRRIYMGDNVIADEDLFPDRNGYSEGHWEGDTLVVKTTHLLELPESSYPHGEQAEIIERYSVSTDSAGTRVMSLDMTITDPQYYTEPVSVSRQMGYKEGERLLPYECAEFDWYRFLDERREELGL